MWYSMTWNLIHLKSNAVLDIVKIDYSFKVLDLEKVKYLVFLFFSFLFFFFFFFLLFAWKSLLSKTFIKNYNISRGSSNKHSIYKQFTR